MEQNRLILIICILRCIPGFILGRHHHLINAIFCKIVFANGIVILIPAAASGRDLIIDDRRYFTIGTPYRFTVFGDHNFQRVLYQAVGIILCNHKVIIQSLHISSAICNQFCQVITILINRSKTIDGKLHFCSFHISGFILHGHSQCVDTIILLRFLEGIECTFSGRTVYRQILDKLAGYIFILNALSSSQKLHFIAIIIDVAEADGKLQIVLECLTVSIFIVERNRWLFNCGINNEIFSGNRRAIVGIFTLIACHVGKLNIKSIVAIFFVIDGSRMIISAARPRNIVGRNGDALSFLRSSGCNLHTGRIKVMFVNDNRCHSCF